MSMLIFFFFFSSRRRHTRCSRDWSSDVCSSDLRAKATFEEQLQFTRAEVAPGSADLIAWPENAISDVLTDDPAYLAELAGLVREKRARDRKSTRLNSSHGYISYAVFCLKKKKTIPLHTSPDI